MLGHQHLDVAATAQTMAAALSRLKGRGCDIKMLMTQQGGSTTISSAVIKVLNKASIPFKCTATAMHKMCIRDRCCPSC